ncbi:MAG: glycoside hydrolase, partial [Thermoanaerobaculia bacterium]
DSGTVAIASRSDYGQLTFRDWHPIGGDERDGDIPDPRDPDIVYGAGLGGRLSKWNARTGEAQNVSPWPLASYGARPGSTRYRYSWITPVAISPRPPHAIYQGAQVLFRSLDRGASWSTVSPDLTGAVPAAAGCAGDVPVERASACGFGVIFAIAPSPAVDGTVWIGTDNGRVQLTRDDAATWRDVTPPGLGDWSKVNTIDASATDPATAYVAADRHRMDESRPVAFRTHDFGATWIDIAGGLPQDEWLGALRQDPQRAGLLYAGTNRGVHVSFDDGATWQSLQLNLPTTGINDLLIAGEDGGDLIVATQGRAIWALDVLEPLRHLAPAAGVDPLDRTRPVLLPPAPAVRLRFNQNKDTPLPPEEPRGENPPTGAVLDYLLPAAANGPVVLEIYDAAGLRVRRFASDESPVRSRSGVYFTDHWLADADLPATTAGHHRFVWDLRRERPRALDYDYSIAAIPGRETPPAPAGALVPPGRYEARLTVDGELSRQPLTVVADPRLQRTAADYAALDGFQAAVAGLLADSATLATAVGGIEKRLDAAPKRSDGNPARWVDEARRQLREVRGGDDPAAVNGNLSGLAADLESSDSAPTAPQREVFALSRGQLEQFAARWHEFAKRDLPRLEQQLHGPKGAR